MCTTSNIWLKITHLQSKEPKETSVNVSNTVYHKTFIYLYIYIVYQFVQDNVHALNRTTNPGPGSISTASDGLDSDLRIWTLSELMDGSFTCMKSCSVFIKVHKNRPSEVNVMRRLLRRKVFNKKNKSGLQSGAILIS